MKADNVEYYNSRSAKRTAAGVLIFNRRRLLIVRPTYLENDWLLVGGGINSDELPSVAASRECCEELGINPLPLHPAYVNNYSADFLERNGYPGLSEVTQHIFVADVDQSFGLDYIRPNQTEIAEAKFVLVGQLSAYLARCEVFTVQAYINAVGRFKRPGVFYMNNGQVIY